MALSRITDDSVTCFELFVSCPLCIGAGNIISSTKQLHHNCGGELYIGDNAFVCCKQCGTNEHISKWEFGCNIHNTKLPQGEWAISEQLDMADSTNMPLEGMMSIPGQMVEETGIDWLSTFLNNL